MSKPDDLTSVTRDILSDEEAEKIYQQPTYRDHMHCLRAVLNAFAQRAGVTGERHNVEIPNGRAVVDSNYFYVWKEGAWARGPYLPATIYIHPPAPAKKSAEERIEEALKIANEAHLHGPGCYDTQDRSRPGFDICPRCRVGRILRGEE